MLSQLAVPMRRKGRVIGALNLLSEAEAAFTSQDEALLRQFAAHVAVAIENARLFRSERQSVDTLETLAEIGREMSSILDLDALLTRIASLTKRLIDYRTFGILLVNQETDELEMKLAVRYGKGAETKRQAWRGAGRLVGAAQGAGAGLRRLARSALHQLGRGRAIRAGDPDAVEDRCIGVFDLEPRTGCVHQGTHGAADAARQPGGRGDRECAAVEQVRRSEERFEKELRFAQRVQIALLPTELPRQFDEADVAASFEAARELGGDLHDFLLPEPKALVVAVGDVSGKGAPAAIYGAFAAELVRARTMRRRFSPERFRVSGVLQSMNTTLHERQLEEYYCTLCYALFDFPRGVVTMSNSGLPYPIHCSAAGCRQIELPGVPLGSFAGVTYDEIELPLRRRVRVLYRRCLRRVERTRRGFRSTRVWRSSSSTGISRPVASSTRSSSRHRFPRHSHAGRRYDRRRRQDTRARGGW